MPSLHILRQHFLTWAFTALLPLPILLAAGPAAPAAIKCLYLGLASAWFAVEVFRTDGGFESPARHRDKLLAVLLALTASVSLFIVLGLSAGVSSKFPFPLMAAFAAVPAVGMLPWLTQRIRQPYAALILGATIVALCKLAACVVARIVYGPDFLEAGYVAADWRTAKLMISVFWALTITISAAMLCLSFRRAGPPAIAATPSLAEC